MKHSLLLLALIFISVLPAYTQTTEASITGKITDDQKNAIAGASIEIRNESTGFTTRTTTNTNGDFTFRELPLGGPYTVKSAFIGYGEQTQNGYMLNQGDVVRVNIQMTTTSQDLEAVEINANTLINRRENIGAATAVNSRDMVRLPVNGRNFTSLMELSPLTVGGNLAGQLGSSTNFTIDGMTAKNPTSAGPTTSRSGAPYSISIEAVREFKVVTNQYDVTFGRAGGGTVSAVTKSGTNTLTGSAWNYARADWLSSPYDIRGNRRENDFSTYQYGFTLGGPIVKDKLHFFVAWDHQRDARPLIIADVQSPLDESRFNITRATLDEFVDIGRRQYGLGSGAQYGSFDKRRGSDAVFGRIDWQINDKNLLTVRNNFTSDRNKLGLADNTSINLYESYGNDYNVDNSFLATLRTTVSPRITNELKLQHLYTYQESSPGDELPDANIPRAIVENVISNIDETNRSTNIQLGGHRFAQEGFTNNVIQLINNLYYNTDKVNYLFGTDLMYTHANSIYGSEVNGRFHFTNSTDVSSLENFNNLRPYRYYREVPLMDDPSVLSNIFNVGLYGQMRTQVAKGMEVIGGLRLDYGHYPRSPLNQELFDALGVRTDHRISNFVVQPRFQLNWDVNERHRDYIRIGGGIFASDINNYVVINNLTFDGRHLATVDVQGNDVPTPDFSAYRDNPSTIPAMEQFQLATINTNGPDAKVPIIYKANISYNRYINENLRLGITGYATLGRNNYMYVDRNMAVDPFFTLPEEGSRGVFVPLNTMPENGAADWTRGRITEQFGRVLELNSEGRVNQFAVVIDGTYRYFRDGEISLSYTWNDTKDNTSFNGNVANSATLSLPVRDDPRDLSTMSYSNGHFRSKVVFYGSLPTFYGISIGVRYSGIGGTRYSLLSGGNTNGDFVSGTNDLAFIFDRNSPATPDRIRTGLEAILDNAEASQSLKEYILKYEGQIAERNGGVNGFFGVWDIRVTKKFTLYKTHALELSADIFNVANLLNRSWGVNETLGNQALYAIGVPAEGLPQFDRENRRFNYRVNNSGVVVPSGNPYQFQLGVRYGF
ncbi:TonB-dependent receptor [Olivibacter sp. SDN3]|uniref:TonB-dependent receptor n=1 Tax=Olivibacter sp. SDN3 TaxID=2764720 RepID=UPI00165116B0|nr:carboxypeptidase regulatory-like domain-containing protein [Olivibacter sp. SDN3]QNL50769.1 TonB-dependent receptor [Olivibacter sp. SDN3]